MGTKTSGIIILRLIETFSLTCDKKYLRNNCGMRRPFKVEFCISLYYKV